MKVYGKKAILHKCLSFAYGLFNRKKTIVFYAPKLFHYAHISGVVEEIACHANSFEVIVICPEKIELDSDNIKKISSSEELALWRKVDLFITTEFYAVPYWLTTCSIFFGHGIGPKLDYQSPELLSQVDYLFSPCEVFYNYQSKIVDPDKIFKVGLPVLDNKGENDFDVYGYFDISTDKPLIVYAPSWCAYPEYLSDIDKALETLNLIDEANIIICPHPNLLEKERCGGNDLFGNCRRYDNLYYNFPESGLSTLDICKYADLVISDISSVLFEAMALDKVVLFENNRGVFEKFGAIDIYFQLIDCCFVVNWGMVTPSEILGNITNDRFAKLRSQFIESYLFNKGEATKKFIECIINIIK
jgi:hypothetical protein